MAKNAVYSEADELSVVVTHPASPKSGDPVRYGQRPGVALKDENADTGKTTVYFDGEYTLSVKAVDTAGAEGDILYYVDADTPTLSKKNTGVRYGYAGAAITGGQTADIPVIIGY
jgi:predicted RecA/RadA family phage recombinase